VEEMVAGLLENAGQMRVEAFEVELDVFLFLAVDQGEDTLTGAEGICPLFHLQRVLQLNMSQVKQLSSALFVVKRDGVGDLVVLEELWLL
jgi:hypothetical protein